MDNPAVVGISDHDPGFGSYEKVRRLNYEKIIARELIPLCRLAFTLTTMG